MENENQTIKSFEEFKEDWLLKHPASIPVEDIEDSPYPRWLRGATFLMFLAAALLSAVHTIPVVYAGIPSNSIISPEIRTAAANASIIAFELGILLSAFLMIAKSSMGLAWLLLGTMFTGTIIANIQSISQTSSEGIGSSVVTIVFGAGIPVIALAAGKLFVNIYTTERTLKKRGKESYREALKELDTIINQAHTKYLKQHDTSRNFVKSDEAQPVHETSRSPVKPRVKIHEIAEIIYENGDGKLSANEMMDKYNISLGSTTKIREMLKDRNANGFANGRGLH